MKNKKEIAFIISVNNEMLFNECLYYIHHLEIPEGYNIDVIAIREAESMCAAYNAGMRSSNAKYKIYMHQDVLLQNRRILHEIISRFQNRQTLGMIGMIGGASIPDTGIVFDSWNVGKVDVREPDMSYYMHTDDRIKADTFVAAIDGMFMATQYDIPWREDLFFTFDFYDISQSCEFRRAGYEILVPYQEIPWVLHNCGYAKLKNYFREKDIFLKEYSAMTSTSKRNEFVYDAEWERLSIQLEHQLENLLKEGRWDEAEEILQIYHTRNFKSSGLEEIAVMVEIHATEGKSGMPPLFFSQMNTYDQMKEWYLLVRLAVIRMELADTDEEYRELIQLLHENQTFYTAVLVIIMHAVVDKQKVLERLFRIYLDCGNQKASEQIRELLKIFRNKRIPIAYSRGIGDKEKR